MPVAVLHLLAEAVELLLGEPALEEGAGVDAGGAVPLDVDLVAAAGGVLALEEVVEADLVEAGGGLVGGDVTADLEALAVGAGDHHGGVPPDEGPDPPLDVLVAGEPGLPLGRDRVDVVGAAQGRHPDLGLPGPLEQPQHHVARALAAALADQGVERVDPVGGLVGVDVRELGRQPLVDHRGSGARSGTIHGGFDVAHRFILTRRGQGRNLPRSTHGARAAGPRRWTMVNAGLRPRANSGGLLHTRRPYASGHVRDKTMTGRRMEAT